MRGSIQQLGEVANVPKAKGGRMPVVTSTLRDSFQSSLHGASLGSGPDAATFAAMSAQTGDVIIMGWGGAASAYARRVNYGFNGTDSLGRTYNQKGAHFMEYGADQWQNIVREQCALARASVK